MIRLLLAAAVLALPIAVFMPQDADTTMMSIVGAGYAVAVMLVWWNTGKKQRRVRAMWRV